MAQPDFKKEAEAIFDEMVATRRDFHQHPELGFQEVRTSRIVADRLTELGLEVQRGVAQTGVIGLLEGRKPGPTVMMRFDMDALPIHEENDVPYKSKNPGVMHACGHDAHTAMGLGMAKIMSKYQDRIAGTLKFVFQPAEEGGAGGAFAMIADGALENPKPDVAFAMHVWNPVPYGRVRVVEGPCMASSSVLPASSLGDSVDIPFSLPHRVVCTKIVCSTQKKGTRRSKVPKFKVPFPQRGTDSFQLRMAFPPC